MKTTLYQLDSKNNIKVWTIEVKDLGDKAEIYTGSGRMGGKMTPNSVFITEGLNLGKSNSTTYFTQALSEAQSKIDRKIKEGYGEDVNNIKASDSVGIDGMREPMLAHKYDPTGKQKSSKTLKQIGIEGKTVVTQFKKDGNRLIFKVLREQDGTYTAGLYSRKGERFPSLPHIEQQVIECFSKIYNYVNSKYGVVGYDLDGELYVNPEIMSFNKLNGLVKKQKRTVEDLKLIEQIEYHVYDVDLSVGYETRDKVKDYFKHTHLKPLKSDYVIATDENLKVKLEEALNAGEEGLMIRQLGLPYEHKRTWQLIKYKLFQDEEFEVVGFEESVRGGMVGAVVLKAPSNAYDRDGKKIETFNAAMKMPFEERINIWNNQSKYIGLKATIEFFAYSEYQIPRFPKCKGFRNDV